MNKKRNEQEKILKIKIRTHILVLLLLVLFVKCSRKKTNLIENKRLIIHIQDKYIVDSLEYGELIYKSEILDTFKLGKNDKRYLWFSFGIFDTPKSVKQLQKQEEVLESYNAINDSVIPFDSKAIKRGEHYLEGYIEETFLLPEYYKTGDAKKITNLIKVSKKIIVE